VVVKAFGVEILFEKIRITISRVCAVACSQAVAKGDDDGAIVPNRRRGLGRCGGRRRRSGFRRRLSLAAGDGNCKCRGQGKTKVKPKAKLWPGTARVHHTFNLAADGNLVAAESRRTQA